MFAKIFDSRKTAAREVAIAVQRAPLFERPESEDERAAQAWLEAQIQRMFAGERFGLIDVRITRPLARALKALNRRNRKFNARNWQRIMKAILGFRWINNGHPIIIAWNGELIDGQHRVEAVIETGVEVVLDLRFGIDPEAFKKMDNGKPRSGADCLHIEGHTMEKSLAAAARLVERLQAGEMHDAALRFGGLANDELVAFIKTHPGIEEAVREGHLINDVYRVNEAGASAGCYLIVEKYGVEAARAFLARVRGDVFVSKNEPAAHLNDLLKRRKVKDRIQVAAAIVNAWNLARTNRKKGAVEMKPGMAFPKVL